MRHHLAPILSLLVPALACSAPLPPRVAAPPGAFPFAEYDALLKKYVDDAGRVDYAALRKGDAQTVERLYASIAKTGPNLTPALYQGNNAALAYYLSAYNVLVWKNILDRSPKRVDENLYSFFREPDFQVDGKVVDLDDLEKKIIRPTFKDGRIHFALNCASLGCPRLPRDAFSPKNLDAQLDREARRFCEDPRNVRYDPTEKALKLSMIFKWYKDDFGKDVVSFINRHRPPMSQIPQPAKIEYVEYDWRLNDRAAPR